MSLHTDGIIAEAEGNSCLVCRHFQMRGNGVLIVCTQKPRVNIRTADWSADDSQRATRRAKECGGFDDMRPMEYR